MLKDRFLIVILESLAEHILEICNCVFIWTERGIDPQIPMKTQAYNGLWKAMGCGIYLFSEIQDFVGRELPYDVPELCSPPGLVIWYNEDHLAFEMVGGYEKGDYYICEVVEEVACVAPCGEHQRWNGMGHLALWGVCGICSFQR